MNEWMDILVRQAWLPVIIKTKQNNDQPLYKVEE